MQDAINHVAANIYQGDIGLVPATIKGFLGSLNTPQNKDELLVFDCPFNLVVETERFFVFFITEL